MQDIFHDGHSTHFDDVTPQTRPCNNNYLRAITLNRNIIAYPARVRVMTPCSAIHDALEARGLAC